ncbi:putative bacterioferritin comigratory protein [Nostoc commune NIES-4072]|uniref:Putative bacterioferritin comigratory protein n=1 Tax=Nostoc commune NIES-4072 TaxID=2005467 RepID=A0A2R5FE60_NOSCO|nr:2OG-Fe(II) oxygenase [Nostoc commune]BBD65978.1 putative bacterioferritin comigratory protein [Nostoc commune HK-02]GBG16697.1 putative bacterioferritin comigratory protein [Nostoc commune NIES-4072]
MLSLTVGDPVPWFILPSTSNPTFHFNSVGGYRVILFFFGSTKNNRIREILNQFCTRQNQLASYQAPFFGVSIDSDDTFLAELVENKTYFKFLWDFKREASIQYGVCQPDNPAGSGLQYQPKIFILDENLRVLQVIHALAVANPVEQVFEFIKGLPAIPPTSLAPKLAPVLFIPNVLEPSFCQNLIDLYLADGGQDSGFMRQIDGKTVGVYDYSFKKRRDYFISDPQLLQQINQRIVRRVKPEIEKAFQFSITRFERQVVACYEATEQAFFSRHRDNTTKGTAHRRFAMSLNLNTGSYEGGYLRFPEYGSQLYCPNTGEALIFSCSLLHEATPVISGQRFVLLSFFYNDEDAQFRENNSQYIALNSTTDI